MIDAPADSSALALRRLGCKMATGSGKTIVMAMLVAWAFEARGYARIQLHTLPGNEPSARVAERAGFKREGLLRSFAMMKGGRTDIVMFSLLPGEL